MKWQLRVPSLTLFASAMVVSIPHAAAQYATEVVSYDPGTTAAIGYDNLAAPLGSPEHFTGEDVFPAVVSPFNPPFLTTELISVGEGGWLTLRLSHYALPQAGSPEIGIFTNAGLLDANYPNGKAGSPPSTFGVDRALVEISENGSDWESLGIKTFDIPTNGYTDLVDPFSNTAGNSPANPQIPFAGSLDDFSDLPYADTGNPDILDLLNGSAGGTWIDISDTSFSQIGYVRFQVADDGTSTELNFELDALSIAQNAMGPMTVPEPGTLTLFGLSGALIFLLQRKRVG